MAKLYDPPDILATSPKLRAKQTADLLAEQWQVNPVIEPWLARIEIEPLLTWLRTFSANRIVLVGHEPQLSEWVQAICTHHRAEGWLELKKAAAVVVRVNSLSGTSISGKLLLHLSPRILRMLGKP